LAGLPELFIACPVATGVSPVASERLSGKVPPLPGLPKLMLVGRGLRV